METKGLPDKGKPIIFISHRSTDKAVADMLADFFYGTGIPRDTVFCSSLPGNDVNEKISHEVKASIKNSVINIVILSQDYYESDYCQNEAGILWYLEDVPVVPIALPEIDYNNMYGFLGNEYKLRRLDSNTDVSYIYDAVSEAVSAPHTKAGVITSEINKLMERYAAFLQTRETPKTESAVLPYVVGVNTQTQKAVECTEVDADIEYDEFNFLAGSFNIKNGDKLSTTPFEERYNVDEEIDLLFGEPDFAKQDGKLVSSMQEKINAKKAQTFSDNLISRADLFSQREYTFIPDICLFQNKTYNITGGKHFCLPVISTIKTLVFEIERKADFNDMSSYLVLKELDSVIQQDEIGMNAKELYYIDNIRIDGNFLCILHINTSKGEIFINNGMLDGDKVLLSKKPIRYSFGNLRCEFNKEFSSSVYENGVKNADDTTAQDFWFPTNINDSSAVIIDLETIAPVKRNIYFDPETKTRKSKIKLSVGKSYFVFRVVEADSRKIIKDPAHLHSSGRRPLSKLELARLFRTGKHGFPIDTATSAAYYEKSGTPHAIYELATLFREDESIRDDDLYKEYLLKAIKSGCVPALCEYTLTFYESLLEDEKREITEALLHLSSEGSSIVNFVMAYMTENCTMAGDSNTAFEYYYKAAQEMFLPACARLGCRSVDNIPMSELRRNFIENANYGITIAQYGMGGICFFGVELYPDKIRGLKLLNDSAENGNRMAAKTLFEIYDNDADLKDKILAFKWLEKIASFDDSYLMKLAYRLQEGEGCEVSELNDQIAFEIYRKKAADENKTALNNLGWCYMNGRGCTQDYTMAISLFEQSGIATSYYLLGKIYELGLGVSADKDKALNYYRTAAEMGNEFAQEKIRALSEL